MFEIIEFWKSGPSPLFKSDTDRRHFMRLTRRLGDRWSVSPRAFRLGPTWASFLVEGDAASVGQWTRLMQTGYGVRRYHQHDPMMWQPVMRVALPGEASARDASDRLHRGMEPDPLMVPWSSLRDGLGLRRADWFDGGWLAARGGPGLYQGAGGLERLPDPDGALALSGFAALPEHDPWPLVEAAVAASTGADPTGRRMKTLCAQVAWARGWSLKGLARRLEVQVIAVRRMLRRERVLAAQRAVLHLEDARLRSALADDEGRFRWRWQSAEPPWARLHRAAMSPVVGPTVGPTVGPAC